MTGSGSSGDPYVIYDINDIKQIYNKGQYNYHFKLNNDIDFTGTSYAMDYVPINLEFATFDGQGHTIRGIYKTSPASDASLFLGTHSYGLTIKNLNIEAEFSCSTFSLVNNPKLPAVNYTYENCKFVLNLYEGTTPQSNTNSGSLFGTNSLCQKFKYCTFIINGSLHSAHNFLKNGSFTGCQFRFDTIVYNVDSDSSINGFFKDIPMSDIGFFGRIRFQTETPPESFLFADGGAASNCYQVIRYEGCGSVVWNSEINTVCFWDNENSGEAEIVNTNSSEQAARLLSLASEQCKNAAYLRSVGYSCEGE